MLDDDKFRELSQSWIVAKEREREAVDERRSIEDQLSKMINLDETEEGTVRFSDFGLNVKITSRLNRKVDSELLQDIAAENGLSDHLPALFRWKPDINLSAWKKADASITGPLLGAITTVPSRPSYSISYEDGE